MATEGTFIENQESEMSSHETNNTSIDVKFSITSEGGDGVSPSDSTVISSDAASSNDVASSSDSAVTSDDATSSSHTSFSSNGVVPDDPSFVSTDKADDTSFDIEAALTRNGETALTTAPGSPPSSASPEVESTDVESTESSITTTRAD